MAQSNTSLNQYDDLRKEVAQRYEQLHPDLKAALVSVDTAGAVYEIAKKFGLNIEKTGHLADVIGYTIIGLLPVADFINNLKDTIGIDGTKAEEISREVNNKIFLAIREQLKKTHGEKWDERAMTTSQETRDKRQETRETVPTVAAVPQAPTTPKSPWEIKPDGMAQETRDKRQEVLGKSVIPPVKPELGITNNELGGTAKIAEAEVKAEVKQEARGKKQETTPPEPPKTREAPQPAPMMKGGEVLKEIRPTGLHEQSQTAIQTDANSVMLQQKIGTTPLTGLPIMKEAEKLMQTPELNKPTTNNQQPTTLSLKPTTNNLQPITPKPQTPTTPQTPTPAQQKPAQTSPAPTPKYNADPYREPIE